MKVLLIPEGMYAQQCNDLNDAVEKMSIYRQNNPRMLAMYAELGAGTSGINLDIKNLKFKSI
jgi:hypothetical protein